jgi:hypothetical protein
MGNKPNPRSKVHCAAKTLFALGVALLLLPGSQAPAQEWTPDKDQVVEQPEPYSPYVDQHFPQRVLWGDTHHHSSFSVDSGLIGNTLGPDVSFRFARGEEVISNSGQRSKLNRPLDFLVVSDHAEYLGIADLLNTGNPALLATDGSLTLPPNTTSPAPSRLSTGTNTARSTVAPTCTGSWSFATVPIG